jgi:CRP/FNR family transcriptional regulator
LRQAKLFEGLDDQQLDAIGGRGRRRTLGRGQTLFLEGDKAEGLFLVLRGRVKVYKTSPRGRQQILLLLGPGETVGEVAMFAGETFPASSESLEAAEVFSLPRAAFLEIIRGEPEVAMKLLGSLSTRLRSFASLIEDLSLREVSERLDREGGSKGAMELDTTRAQMAATFGTVPETLSRAFQQLRKAGAIETAGRHVRIRDQAILHRISMGR